MRYERYLHANQILSTKRVKTWSDERGVGSDWGMREGKPNHFSPAKGEDRVPVNSGISGCSRWLQVLFVQQDRSWGWGYSCPRRIIRLERRRVSSISRI